MSVVAMNHFTVIARNLEETKVFYCELLNLKEGFRPKLGFPGAWLYVEDNPVLHIIAGRKRPTEITGVIDHMAFTGTNLPKFLKTLEKNNVKYTLKKQPETGIWQLFTVDPNGARVEIDFPATENPK